MTNDDLAFYCPLPADPKDCVLLAHGDGAGKTRRLIRDLFLSEFDNPYLKPLADAAFLPSRPGRLVVTTDGSVVSPWSFPGGDIGRMAVHGAINDLAVSRAEPLYLTVAFVLEEGLPLAVLRQVVASIAAASRESGVHIVAGDTKVVPRGAADGLFIVTTGIGWASADEAWDPRRIQRDDQLIVSGSIGDHGMAILAARERLGFEGDLTSDSAPLYNLIQQFADIPGVRWLRDATRGGVAAICHELAEATNLGVRLHEAELPVRPVVRAACELLGLDPIHLANEGKLIAVVAPDASKEVLARMQAHPQGRDARLIGSITNRDAPAVIIRTRLGTYRPLEEPSGSPLPRIC